MIRVKPTVAWYESYHSYPGRPDLQVPDKNAGMVYRNNLASDG